MRGGTSLSKATKKRSKENAFKTRARKLTQRAVSAFLALLKHTVLARTADIVNPYVSRVANTLRLCALGQARLPRKPARSLTRICSRDRCWAGWQPAWLARLFLSVGPHAQTALFRGGLATWFGMRTNSVGGCSRIARGAPVAGSVTGGEACGYPCSEKEGFTHRWFWRTCVLLGCQKRGDCTLRQLTGHSFIKRFLPSFLCRPGQRNDVLHAQWLTVIKKLANSLRPLTLESSNPAMAGPQTLEPGTPAMTQTTNPI